MKPIQPTPLLRRVPSRPRLLILALAAAGVCAGATSAQAPDQKDSRTPKEVQAALEDLDHLRRLAGEAETAPDALWRAWQTFRVTHATTPEYFQAAEIMRKAPSPLDHLDRDQIPVEDRRPWLPKEVVAVLGEHLARQGSEVWEVAVTSDGRLAASSASMYKAHLWDVKTMNELGVFNDAHSMALFPDGQTLATGGADGDRAAGDFTSTVRLWDISGGKPKERAVFHGQGSVTTFLALAADRKTLLMLDDNIR